MKPQKLKRVVIKEELVALTGNHVCALILNQFIFWSERIDDTDKFLEEERTRNPELEIEPLHGWVFKKADELISELMLDTSATTIRRYITKLVDLKLLAERHNPKVKYDRTMQYRPDILEIQKQLQDLGYALEGYPLYRPAGANLQNEDSNLQDEDSNLQGEEWKNQNGVSKLQNGVSKLQNERAIPEITPEITPENLYKEREPKNELEPEPKSTVDTLISATTEHNPINQPKDSSEGQTSAAVAVQNYNPTDPFFKRRPRPNENYQGAPPLEKWEILPGEPYPYFWQWREGQLRKQGGSIAENPKSNAYSEFYNNRARAKVLWREFLDFYKITLDNALQIQASGMTPTLPSCFSNDAPVTEEQITKKLNALGTNVLVGLPQATATPSCNESKSWESPSAIAEKQDEDPHRLPEAATIRSDRSLEESGERREDPSALYTPAFRRQPQNSQAYLIYSAAEQLPPPSPPPPDFFEKLTIKCSMPKLERRTPEQPTDPFQKYRGYLHSQELALRNEAIRWVMQRNDADITYDEEGDIIDFTEIEF